MGGKGPAHLSKITFACLLCCRSIIELMMCGCSLSFIVQNRLYLIPLLSKVSYTFLELEAKTEDLDIIANIINIIISWCTEFILKQSTIPFLSADSRRPKAPSKKKFEEDMEVLGSSIRAKEQELEASVSLTCHLELFVTFSLYKYNMLH